MNKETNALNALVSLQVCPRRRGASSCCSQCHYKELNNCHEELCTVCTKVLSDYFTQPTVGASVAPTLNANISKQIDNVLLDIGIPMHLTGYPYVKRAIIIVAEDPERINRITYELYPELASEFSTSANRVERAIRHGIEIAFDRCDVDVLYRYFGNSISPIKGKPTNSEFIARIAAYVRNHSDAV